MVKFSREYEASIIPEWKAAFVDYKGLKKLVKRIKIARRDAAPLLLAGRREAAATGGGGRSDTSSGSYGFSVLDPVRALAAHFAATPPASPVRRRVVCAFVVRRRRRRIYIHIHILQPYMHTSSE